MATSEIEKFFRVRMTRKTFLMIEQNELEKRVKTGHVVKKFNVNSAATGRKVSGRSERERRYGEIRARRRPICAGSEKEIFSFTFFPPRSLFFRLLFIFVYVAIGGLTIHSLITILHHIVCGYTWTPIFMCDLCSRGETWCDANTRFNPICKKGHKVPVRALIIRQSIKKLLVRKTNWNFLIN